MNDTIKAFMDQAEFIQKLAGIVGMDWQNSNVSTRHAELEQACADLGAENKRLRGLLGDCLDWMESTRRSGDCGCWEWVDEDEYARGIAELKETP